MAKSNVALAQNVFVECAEQSTAKVIQPHLQLQYQEKKKRNNSDKDGFLGIDKPNLSVRRRRRFSVMRLAHGEDRMQSV